MDQNKRTKELKKVPSETKAATRSVVLLCEDHTKGLQMDSECCGYNGG